VVVWMMAVCGLRAQDPVMSQPYASAMGVNPGFAGITEMPLIHLSYRNQWPGFNRAYVTYSLDYSQYVDRMHSAFGLELQADNAGRGLFVTTAYRAFYAYRLEPLPGWYLKLGTYVGGVTNHLAWGRLLFPDDLDEEGNHSGMPSEWPGRPGITYLDVGSGLLFYNDRFFAGYSMAHINRPDNRLLDQGAHLYGGLPIRHSVQLSMRFDLDRQTGHSGRSYFQPYLSWHKQTDFVQWDVDMLLGFGRFFAGLGIRNTPTGADAAKLMAGFSEGILKVGYSYDFTISELTNASAGSHEVAIILNFDQSARAKKRHSRSYTGDCFDFFR